MTSTLFKTPIAYQVWQARYRYQASATEQEQDITDTWRRVARTLSRPEQRDRAHWESAFYELLRDFRFLPGGRILAGAGTGRRVTLFNCFVMGTIEDSLEGIFSALKEGALTMQQGGGVGYDFSTLRPAGSRARGTGAIASGPVSFMRIWDSMCATLLSTGARRGAMMATLRCDHPDILTFIDAKQDARELRHFNLSVLVTDAFMQAVQADADWPLVFPDAMLEERAGDAGAATPVRDWPGHDRPVACRVFRVLPAREVWQRLTRASYDYAEPGVLFIDRINSCNNLWYRERISATNPCGEIPLPPYGACDLGSLNLTRFVVQPFEAAARFDFDAFRDAARVAVRMLDNVIDVSGFPLQAQQENVRQTRRIGLGITGLADALMMLGLRYGTQASYDRAAEIVRVLCHTAYRSSVRLAAEKGVFPAYDAGPYLQGPFIQALPADIRAAITDNGIRNSHLLAIAPTGTISLLANNVSSSLEPVFDASYQRRIRQPDGSAETHEVMDYACYLWQVELGRQGLPPAFTDAHALTPDMHLGMQAALQPFIDNAISKTINIPRDFSFTDYQSVYSRAYALGLKGCTTFRPNPVTGDVLSTGADGESAVFCCDLDREPD